MPITQTAEHYTTERTHIEITIPVGLSAIAGTTIVVGDEGSDVSFSAYLNQAGSNAAQATTVQRYVTGDDSPITVTDRREQIEQWPLTLLDNDHALEDLGLTADVNLFDDILIPLKKSGLAFVMKCARQGDVTGNKIETYNGCKVSSVGKPSANADNGTELGSRAVTIEAPEYTDSVATIA